MLSRSVVRLRRLWYHGRVRAGGLWRRPGEHRDRRYSDAKLPGPGVTFALTRAYALLDITGGPLGSGWTDPYQAALSFDDSGNATLRSADGQQSDVGYDRRRRRLSLRAGAS